jgi:N-methylhydantoinase A
MADTYIVGLDIGGTFTDAATIASPSGRVIAAKIPTTPDDLREGLIAAVSALAVEAGLPVDVFLGRVTRFAHATTQTSNVMFTWSGAAVGLITTRGFADELLIMRARGRVAGLSVTERRHLQRTNKPPFVVPPDRIVEVRERIDHSGRVVIPIQLEDVVTGVNRLLDQGVRAIAVSLLWSPRNPSHELAVEEVIRQIDPTLQISLSHKVAPVLGEYERAATAAVNSYVAPVLEGYLRSVDASLRNAGLRRRLMVIQADGGSTPAEKVIPVRTIESGPAAGMVAVKTLGDAIDERNIIATDVGGTTFKVGLMLDGSWNLARETVINQYTLSMPMIDLVSIGAGGGSIAWVDGARLRVGPMSAGADPGPACYGLGGKRPTVTDADVALGFIGADRLLGNRFQLRSDLASAAIKDHVAEPMFGGDVTAAAAAIRRIVDAQMSGLVRKTTLERGFDPRRFALMAYGGSGPVHAADYAAGLGIRRVIVPGAATVYSALGAAISDVRFSIEQPLHESLTEAGSLQSTVDALEDAVRRTIDSFDVTTETRVEYWAEVRYEKQLHSIRIVLDPEELNEAGIRARFLARYATLYGQGALMPAVGVRLLRLGVDGIGVIEKAAMLTIPDRSNGTGDAGTRDVYWPTAQTWMATTVLDSATLGPGSEIAGPALVEYPGTTAAVPAGARASIDRFGNLTMELELPR